MSSADKSSSLYAADVRLDKYINQSNGVEQCTWSHVVRQQGT